MNQIFMNPIGSLKTIFAAICLIFLGVLMGCSSAGGSGNLACNGPTCTCLPGDSCDITNTPCGGDSCSLDCVDMNECTGSCGASCSIDCSAGSLCDVTVGNSGSVTCTNGSECNVTCTGNCSVSCSADSVCTLTCPGENTSKPVVGSGQCTI